MLLGLLLAVGLQAGPGAAPPPLELSPGTRYDARIPTPKQAIGHDFGDEISTPDEIVTYLKALAAAAPDRARLVEYGRSWEGRPLVAIAIGSPGRMAGVDQLQADLQRFADPRRTPPAEAEALAARLPVVVWLLHAVHGNEISSCGAAMAEAYHLLAAQRDPGVDLILREAVVLIDPLQNPDGRARFVQQTRMGRAATPDAEPASAEHDEPWPGGRSNHYLFDMNRDWFAQSQPETRARTSFYLSWYPHVAVDLHEMGSDSTYYFAPPADPLNPHISKAQIAWLDTFGRENARRFDERGFPYFTREVFDSFYPGYGESWPIFQGAVGMTYEQASARGLVVRRRDDSLLTYGDGIVKHFTAAIQTAHTAAANRQRLLRDYYEYRRAAVAEGEQGTVREYLVPPGQDPSRAERLVRVLAGQGVEIRKGQEPMKLGARTLPEGTYLISAAQPAGRLVRNLLEPDIPQPDAFVKEQDRRRKKRLPDQIYDLTGWSLPLAFDVEVIPSDRTSTVRAVPYPDPKGGAAGAVPGTAPEQPVVAYVVPWGSGTAAFVARALQSGIKVHTSDLPFRLEGRDYPAGAVVVRAAEQAPAQTQSLLPLARTFGVELVPVSSTYTESGTSLGSNTVVPLKAARVLLAWDEPTSSQSAGWARYVLERRFGHPVTAVRTRMLGRLDLRRWDVLVLPAGFYGDALGGDTLRRLKDWVAAGGTLVTLGEASRWAARENVGLLETRTELRDGRPEVEPSDKDKDKLAEAKPRDPGKPFDLDQAVQPERERPENTPGALVRVVLDREHWLSAGTDGEVQAIVEGQRVFAPIKLDKGRNVGVYAAPDRLVASGLVWEEAQRQLAQKAFLMHQPTGRGQVIAFAEDPNFRAFAEGTELLFMNAVLLGPAHAPGMGRGAED
jgi:hypothetical protein